IASALRASRERAQALAREVLEREAGLERARDELAAERDRMQVTLQSIADGVIATDAQWNITFVNDCAAALTGWPAAEAMGRPLSKVFRTIDAESRRNTALALDEGQSDATADMLLVARNGTERAVESKVRPIRKRDQAPAGFVIV